MKYFHFRIVVVAFLMILSVSDLQAQRRKVMNLPKYDYDPLHFGFILAANQMLLSWKPVSGYQADYYNPGDAPDMSIPDQYLELAEITMRPVPGFAVGIVGNLRLGNYFDLRLVPTLAFGDRIIEYKVNGISYTPLGTISTPYTVTKSLPSTMVDFPLHIKYRSKRLNNFAAYLIAGGKYSIEMASTKKVGTANNNYPVKIDRNDFSAEAGVGFDFYTPYFKFGTELKMSYGMKNILVKDEFMYSSSIDHLNNKVFQLSFTFE